MLPLKQSSRPQLFSEGCFLAADWFAQFLNVLFRAFHWLALPAHHFFFMFAVVAAALHASAFAILLPCYPLSLHAMLSVCGRSFFEVTQMPRDGRLKGGWNKECKTSATGMCS